MLKYFQYSFFSNVLLVNDLIIIMNVCIFIGCLTLTITLVRGFPEER